MKKNNGSGATIMFIEVARRCGAQTLVCSVSGNLNAVDTASVPSPDGGPAGGFFFHDRGRVPW